MSATITDEDRAAIERGVNDLPEQHRAYVRALIAIAFLRGRVVEFERQHPNVKVPNAGNTGARFETTCGAMKDGVRCLLPAGHYLSHRNLSYVWETEAE